MFLTCWNQLPSINGCKFSKFLVWRCEKNITALKAQNNGCRYYWTCSALSMNSFKDLACTRQESKLTHSFCIEVDSPVLKLFRTIHVPKISEASPLEIARNSSLQGILGSWILGTECVFWTQLDKGFLAHGICTSFLDNWTCRTWPVTTGQSWPDVTNSIKFWLKSVASVIQNDCSMCSRCRTWDIKPYCATFGELLKSSLWTSLFYITLRRHSTCRFVNKDPL